MNIGVYSQFDSNFDGVASLTIPVLSQYCKKMGYHLSVSKNPRISESIIWDRVQVWLNNMSKHDWLVHMDVDALVTNPEVRFEDLIDQRCHLMVSRDSNGLNDGVLFIRNSLEARLILLGMWDMIGEKNVFCAQDALRDMMKASGVVRSMVHVAPQARFNSYLYTEYGYGEDTPGHWRAGDFILHLPGRSNARRIEILTQVLNEDSKGNPVEPLHSGVV